MTSKADFVRALQGEPRLFSPADINQRLRMEVHCVSIYQGDAGLPVEYFRGYMVKYADKPNKTAEDPELYVCVISLNQSKPWQDVVWIKEILQILDGPGHRTDTREKLDAMLRDRHPTSPNGDGALMNVVADKHGFVLALGCAVPKAMRDSLRRHRFTERYTPTDLEGFLLIPEEMVGFVLSEEFEERFEQALRSCEA